MKSLAPDSPDDVFSFVASDIPIRLALPQAATDYLQGLIASGGAFYEAALLDEARRFISRRSVVLDVGANIGNHSVYFSKIAGCRQVIAFEPQKDMFQILQRNIALNGLDNCDAHNVLVGRASGRGSLVARNPANLGGAVFAPERCGDTAMICLDVLRLPHADFLKIDVEGMEMDVLSGAQDTIARLKPVIWIELWGHERRAEAAVLLKSWGYSRAITLTEENWLFLPDEIPV